LSPGETALVVVRVRFLIDEGGFVVAHARFLVAESALMIG
jgi:hypothetical protein